MIGERIEVRQTAEGVETQQQLDTLQAVGCTEMQGYLFSRARPAAEVGGLFSTQAEQPAAAPRQPRATSPSGA